jgi:AcrR family transcriptional regulator
MLQDVTAAIPATPGPGAPPPHPGRRSARSGRSGRATPLPRDERRALLIEATLGLLLEHGRDVTTRQIAEAAGVAEGTIFRVYDSKDELVDEAIRAAFAPGKLVDGLMAVDPDQDLRDRLTDIVRVVQNRFLDVFALMAAVGMIEPPRARDNCEEGGADPWRDQAHARMLALIEPDRGLLRVEPAELIHLMRLLTFSGSHAQIADHHLLTPAQIVDVLLDGTLETHPHGIPAVATTSGDLTC